MGADGAQFREFRMLLESKERELITLCDQQIQSLHNQIREKDNLVADLGAKIFQLQDDFKYNLSLLDARDAELAQYDVSTVVLQASVVETDERLKVARKALAEAQTLRLQEKARAEELEQLSQKKISDLEKEMKNLQESKEEMQSKSKHELESTRADLKEQLAEKEGEIEKQKNELQQLEAKADRRRKKLAETEENLRSAETRVAQFIRKLQGATDTVSGTVKTIEANKEKDLEAACAGHKEKDEAATQREDQLREKESELKTQVDKQEKELQGLTKQLKKLEEDKDAEEKAAKWEAKDLKDQLEDLKSHHSMAIDRFKEENDSLKAKWEAQVKQVNQIAEFAEKTRSTQAEIARLTKQLEEKEQELKDLQENHKNLHTRLNDLQEQISGPTGRGSGSASSFPAPSPLGSPGLSYDGDPRSQQEKNLQLEAENRTLLAHARELALQNERIRTVVGNMRSEMEALQRQTGAAKKAKSPPGSPKKDPGLQNLQDEMQYLKDQIQGMAEELGVIRAGSPIHCRRSPSRRSPSRQQKSPQRTKSSQRARSPASPPQPLRRSSPESPKGGVAAKIAELETVQAGLRAQLEATAVDMTRLTNERDLLMELSNSLRADLTRVLHSAGGGDYQASNYGNDAQIVYGGAPPTSLPSQLQREFEPGEIPKNARLLAGMSTSYDVAHARHRAASPPHATRFASYQKPIETNPKHWGYGVAPGGPSKEAVEVSRLQMEGTPYLQERPQMENDTTHKGTASQRARFKAAMKRKEELNKPRVRNWNIKDDHPLET